MVERIVEMYEEENLTFSEIGLILWLDEDEVAWLYSKAKNSRPISELES